MKLIICCAAVLALTTAPAIAQTAPAPAAAPAAPAAPAAAAKFSLESPIETIVADANAKKVLDENLPGLTTNDKYDMFKSMSLNQLAGFAPDKLTPERLSKVEAALAAIK